MQGFPTRFAGLVCIALSIVGCKNSGSSASSTPPTNATVVGLWTGTDSASGDTLNAIIDSANEMVVITSNGTQFVGSLQISGDTIVSAVDGYANYGGSFSDNSIYGIGTLNGTVNPGVSIMATLSFTTNGNTSIPGTWSLTPSEVTSVGSSLSAVTGSFTDNTTSATVVISASGAMSAQNEPGPGCVLSGTIGTADTSINEYQVSYTLQGCTANATDYTLLNGVAFTGMGYLDFSTNPATLIYAVAGSSASGGDFGIVSNLTAP